MSINQEHRASPSVTPPLAAVPAAAQQPRVPVATPGGVSPIRAFLNSRGSGRLADSSFAALILLCAFIIFVIVLFIFTILTIRSHLSLTTFGWRFFIRQAWDPVAGDFGALPFIYGTVMTSILALCMAVPLALGVAIFLTE